MVVDKLLKKYDKKVKKFLQLSLSCGSILLVSEMTRV